MVTFLIIVSVGSLVLWLGALITDQLDDAPDYLNDDLT